MPGFCGQNNNEVWWFLHMACMFVSPLNNIDELIVAPEGIRGKHELPIYIYLLWQ
jgi:hypothetical protein